MSSTESGDNIVTHFICSCCDSWVSFCPLGRRMSWAWWLVFTRNTWSDPSGALSTNHWAGRKTKERTIRGGERLTTITTYRGGVGWPWRSTELLANVATGRWYWSVWYIWWLYRRRWLNLYKVVCFWAYSYWYDIGFSKTLQVWELLNLLVAWGASSSSFAPPGSWKEKPKCLSTFWLFRIFVCSWTILTSVIHVS